MKEYLVCEPLHLNSKNKFRWSFKKEMFFFFEPLHTIHFGTKQTRQADLTVYTMMRAESTVRTSCKDAFSAGCQSVCPAQANLCRSHSVDSVQPVPNASAGTSATHCDHSVSGMVFLMARTKYRAAIL